MNEIHLKSILSFDEEILYFYIVCDKFNIASWTEGTNNQWT